MAVSIGATFAVVAAVSAGHGLGSAAAIGLSAAGLTVLGVVDVRTRRIPNRLVYPALVLAFVVAAVDPARSFAGALLGAAFAGGLFGVAFYVRPSALLRGTVAVQRPQSRSEADVNWAGATGAVVVLLIGIGLVQPNQSVAGAFSAAAVAGCPLLLSPRAGQTIGGGVATAGAVRGMGGGDVKLAALLGAVAGVPGILTVLPVVVFGGAAAALVLAFTRRGGATIPYGPFLAAGVVLAML